MNGPRVQPVIQLPMISAFVTATTLGRGKSPSGQRLIRFAGSKFLLPSPGCWIAANSERSSGVIAKLATSAPAQALKNCRT